MSKLSHTAVRPAEIIRQAEDEWVPRWTADEVSCEEVDALLCRLSEISDVEVEVSFTAAKLLKAAGKMKGTSGGPDNWEVCHFQALPSGFWEALAALWQVVYSTARVPRRWREARVCMVPKLRVGIGPSQSLASPTGSALLCCVGNFGGGQSSGLVLASWVASMGVPLVMCFCGFFMLLKIQWPCSWARTSASTSTL